MTQYHETSYVEAPRPSNVMNADSLGPDLRHEVGLALREQRNDLAATLAAVQARELPLEIAATAWLTLSGQLLDALIAFVEGGQLDAKAEVLEPLERHTHLLLGTKQLFTCVFLAETSSLEALEPNPGLGAATPLWSAVSQLIKRASFDLVGSVTERLAATPAHAAIRDPLTTLLVRAVFDLALSHEVARAQRHQHALAVILFDLDQLSDINARYGYGVGDRVLERMGILIRRFFRTHDWVARHADDSIVVLLPETSLDDATTLAERVRTMVEQRLAFADHNTGGSVAVTLSAAAVGNDYLESELDPYDILSEAEKAVRRAKMSGRNRVERVTLLPMAVSLLGAAGLLDCAPADVRRLVSEGELVGSHKGRQFQIERASLERYRREHSFDSSGDR